MMKKHRLPFGYNIICFMIHQFLHRGQGESKKEYYRRMAQFRKDKYGTESKSVKQETPNDVLKFQEQRLDADIKTKKITKGEPKYQQKIRNRMAAQQSRQRHRLYVQELQRKVKLYQQLIQKQGLVCKNCRKDLHSDFTESQQVTGKQGKVKEEVMIKQEMVEEYLNEQIIRIDNNGAMTPFGIFFVVCVVTVLAVFAGPSQAETRMLTSYVVPIAQIKDFEQPLNVVNIENQMKFTEFLKSKASPFSQHKWAKGEQQKTTKNVGNSAILVQGWTKFGQYVCSSPQVLTNDSKSNKKPQFLLLRTQKNKTEQLNDTHSQQSYKLLSKGWQRVQISQCYLGEP